MATEIVMVDGQTHEIEVKPITLIYKRSNVNDIQYQDDVLVIDPTMTVQHAKSMKTITPLTEKLFKICFKKHNQQLKLEDIQNHIGMLHVIGLLDLTLQCIEAKQKFVWRYPETYLHPEIAAELGDVVICLSQMS